MTLSINPQFLQESILDIPPKVSFEFFPPKNEEMEKRLLETINLLEPLDPDFVSVTYGAGGTTQDRTFGTVKHIIDETSLTPAAHLTCIGASKDEINNVAQSFWDIGVKHIVALRGDFPGETYTPHPEGYNYADDLVAGLKQVADFRISVACYPEKHPEAASLEADIEHLKRKVDAGADHIISQFFFDNDLYKRFVDKVLDAGIHIPITPGILPITNFKQAASFSQKCGATIPQWMVELFNGLDEKPHTHELIAAIIAAEQCRILRDAGVEEFHFYTLNRAELTTAICHLLGVRPHDKDITT